MKYKKKSKIFLLSTYIFLACSAGVLYLDNNINKEITSQTSLNNTKENFTNTSRDNEIEDKNIINYSNDLVYDTNFNEQLKIDFNYIDNGKTGVIEVVYKEYAQSKPYSTIDKVELKNISDSNEIITFRKDDWVDVNSTIFINLNEENLKLDNDYDVYVYTSENNRFNFVNEVSYKIGELYSWENYVSNDKINILVDINSNTDSTIYIDVNLFETSFSEIKNIYITGNDFRNDVSLNSHINNIYEIELENLKHKNKYQVVVEYVNNNNVISKTHSFEQDLFYSDPKNVIIETKIVNDNLEIEIEHEPQTKSRIMSFIVDENPFLKQELITKPKINNNKVLYTITNSELNSKGLDIKNVYNLSVSYTIDDNDTIYSSSTFINELPKNNTMNTWEIILISTTAIIAFLIMIFTIYKIMSKRFKERVIGA